MLKKLFPLLAIAFLLAGCQAAVVENPLTSTLAGNDVDTQLEFWHQLSERKVASNDEVFHGLILYFDGEDSAADYAGRVQILKSRKMLPNNFDAPANHAIRRGDLAVAIVNGLNIDGGVMLSLNRTSPRYATRELQVAQLYPPSSPHQTFSGSEIVGIIGRIEDYERGNPTDVNANVMPSSLKNADVNQAQPPPEQSE